MGIMKRGGTGGAKTKTGLIFEGRTDITTALRLLKGYKVDDNGQIFYQGKLVAISLKKSALYKFLNLNGVDYKTLLSSKLLPDQAILVFSTKTLYVIEMKFQKITGSVDEKLQTSAYKRKQYLRLMQPLNINVEYYYVLSDWFKQDKYKDVLAYIKEIGCDYFFNILPLDRIGLPTAK